MLKQKGIGSQSSLSLHSLFISQQIPIIPHFSPHPRRYPDPLHHQCDNTLLNRVYLADKIYTIPPPEGKQIEGGLNKLR